MRRVIVLVGLALALIVAACSGDGGSDDIEGLRTYEDPSNGHLPGELDYEQWPPAGGDHNPLWQKCGFYTVRVPPERAVHSMEHGAVWVAYSEDISTDDLAELTDRTLDDEYLLVSPLEDLGAPLVASAWGAQIDLDDADDERLDDFIETYSQNGPERAPCFQGGVGDPADDVGPGLEL